MDYFARLQAETPTQLWVNNPTTEEISLALSHGALGCTTNPSFGGGLLKRAPHEVLPIVEEVVRVTVDDQAAADEVQLRLVARVIEGFRPLYERSGGRHGFVSIQGSPTSDHDWEHILAEAHDGIQLGPNAVPKIPATEPGLRAMKQVVGEGRPVIVTEVFSLAQLIQTMEMYAGAVEGTPVPPPFFMSPITGIFGDHLKKVAATKGIECDTGVLEAAGVAFGRACFDLVAQRKYPVTLLFGGARVIADFTGLAGGATAATINYSTVEDILRQNPPVRASILERPDPSVVDELTAKFDDFRRAMMLDGLSLEEFESFGPVMHFRSNFVAGWDSVLAAIGDARTRSAPSLAH